ncbi:MAG TPA: hypothetical protein PLP42_09995 [Acidobacteriota bacterium]|nr:hypothetical protein [Acidobacteriota bacterium]
MNQRFEPLLRASDAKQFVALFTELQESYASIDALLADLVSALAPSLYEPVYDHDPHGFYGLTCAAIVESALPETNRWRPFAQQLWSLRKQRRRIAPPFDTSPVPGNLTREERWDQFKASLQQNFQESFRLARSFLCSTEDRDYFRARSLIFALEDLGLGGHKFNYLAQSWLLAERLGLKHAADSIFGPIHLLAYGAEERSPSHAITEWAGYSSRFENTMISHFIMFEEPREAVSAVAQLTSRTALESVFDTLLLAAAQTLVCAGRKRWLPAVRAFHTAFLCRECLAWFDPNDRLKAALLTAMIINRAARDSEADPKAPALDETIQKVCPTDPFNVLKSVISHSDPYASATAVYAILGMDAERQQDLFQTLMGQALKNDGDICWGHDILFVYEAWTTYLRSELPQRDLFPATAGFFLGQVLKSFELAAEYKV